MKITRFLATRTSTVRILSILCLLLPLAVSFSRAQSASSVKEKYAKYEVYIPMRDGVRLFTAIYVPKDASHTYPILLERTPYTASPYGLGAYPGFMGPLQRFAEEGYIFVFQDVRGRFMSEGEYADVRPQKTSHSRPQDIDESTDTYDTIDWLVKCIPNNNGRVGVWGISYPGFYASAGAVCAHPALKAVSPQAPVTDWFIGDDWHHHGAFLVADAFGFYDSFGLPRPAPTTKWPEPIRYDASDPYKFFLEMGSLRNANEKYFKNRVAFWNDLMQHGTYDSFWKARNIRPHLKNIKAAVMTVGGWFDAEDQYGALHTYEAIERQNPGIQNTLVMGPWFHGGWAGGTGNHFGDIQFDSDTSVHFRDEVQYPFFNYYLKGSGTLNLPEALVFTTGSNKWESFDAWPPRDLKPKSLYFQADKRLSFEPPKETSAEAYDEYVSDPANPVPYTPHPVMRHRLEYMIEDQRFAASRPDVLSHQSDPLTEDVTIAGPIQADLFVSTTGTDADFIVKVIDVFPEDAPDNDRGVKMGGYEMLVRADVMRAKFRNSYEKPEPLTPGKVTEVKFVLPDVCHTFKKGHRLMVQVQSSWFPLIDRNPQKFVDIYNAADTDFQKATHRIYRTAKFPSHVNVGVRER